MSRAQASRPPFRLRYAAPPEGGTSYQTGALLGARQWRPIQWALDTRLGRTSAITRRCSGWRARPSGQDAGPSRSLSSKSQKPTCGNARRWTKPLRLLDRRLGDRRQPGSRGAERWGSHRRGRAQPLPLCSPRAQPLGYGKWRSHAERTASIELRPLSRSAPRGVYVRRNTAMSSVASGLIHPKVSTFAEWQTRRQARPVSPYRIRTFVCV